MIKRILAVFALSLLCHHAAPAQNVKSIPGAAAGGGATTQPGGQPSLPGGLGGANPAGVGGVGAFPGGAGAAQPGACIGAPGGRAGGAATPGGPGGAGQAAGGKGGKLAGPGMPPGGMMGGMSGGPMKQKELKDMTLEELLAKALKDNPDIRVAETKVREAEANLNRTRQDVLQKVSKIHLEIALAQKMEEFAAKLLKMTLDSGGTARQGVEAALTYQQTKSELAKLEAQLPYLVGIQHYAMTGMGGGGMMAPAGGGGFPMAGPGSGFGVGSNPMRSSPEMADPKLLPATLTDKLRKVLDTQVTLRQSDMTLHDAVSFLSDRMQGINLHIGDKKLHDSKVNLYLPEPVALGAVFQYFEDEFDCRCVIREYGIVIVQRERVPPGATPLLEFWKKSRAVESKPK